MVRNELKNQREDRKKRWLVCYDDNEGGAYNPGNKNSKAPKNIRRLIGVAAIITNEKDEVLVGKRMGSHGAGTWALPGGHMDDNREAIKGTKLETKEKEQEENNAPANLDTKDVVDVESVQDASCREAKEETGLSVKAGNLVHTSWEFFNGNPPGFQYYNTFFVWATMADKRAEPVNMEPNKCEEWKFMSWEELRNLWQKNPVIEEQPDEKSTDQQKNGNETSKLFLPLAKLVRDFETLDSLRERNEKLNKPSK